MSITGLQMSITGLKWSITGLKWSITGLKWSITGLKWSIANKENAVPMSKMPVFAIFSKTPRPNCLKSTIFPSLGVIAPAATGS
jgi:hypothetical protein